MFIQLQAYASALWVRGCPWGILEHGLRSPHSYYFNNSVHDGKLPDVGFTLTPGHDHFCSTNASKTMCPVEHNVTEGVWTGSDVRAEGHGI